MIMLREKSKITSKGQITLPIKVRRLLGVKEGDSVVFDVNETGEVLVRPDRGESPFAKYQGVGVDGLDTKEDIQRWLLELRGRDE